MIGRLTGVPLDEGEGAIVIDVNGVGYELQAPMGTLGRAMRDAEGRVTLRVHTHVREDALNGRVYLPAEDLRRFAWPAEGEGDSAAIAA